MAEEKDTNQASLEGGTYEILRKRIEKGAQGLESVLQHLNEERKQVFGTIETKVLLNERVTTSNNCVPWDIFSMNDKVLFGYNVQMGLRQDVKVSDVFSLFTYNDHQFHEEPLQLIEDKQFVDDFEKLYKYYKHTKFVKFAEVGPFLHMVFRVGKEAHDVKTFKWEVRGEKLIYVDNRSDHEYKFPNQYEFEWKRAKRESFREGLHPHVSILDRVFVETVGGDLTIKVEDNTDNGTGIHTEEVSHKQQTLVDAEYHFADLGNLILLKIKPYQEEERYFVFNEKLQEVRRIDTIREACIMLPDDHGLVFSDGYYLQTGEYKQFENGLEHMLFERRISSINGEDTLFVFYNRLKGLYLLLNYNIISQEVNNPLICHGFSLFDNGELCVFRSDDEPKKHHAIQVWQTPFTSPDFQIREIKKSFLQKIGNKEVVRAMAECHEIIGLLSSQEPYADLYVDVIKKCTDINDSYHWLNNPDFNVQGPLEEIRSIAESTVDEYDKVRKLKEHAKSEVQALLDKKQQLISSAKGTYSSIEKYVKLLAEIRSVRGEVITAKEFRYVDIDLLNSIDEELLKAGDSVSESCLRFLLTEKALSPFQERIDEIRSKAGEVSKVVEVDKWLETGKEITNDLDLLIETVSNLKISDATQTTKIIDNISDIYSDYNKVKTELDNRRNSLLSQEGKAEFSSTIKLIEQSVTNYLDVSDTPEKCDEYLSKLAVQLEELEAKFSEFDEFLDDITSKREEIYNAFEAKKLSLTERRNRKASQLSQSATRVLGAIKSKASTLESIDDINSYFASDLMVEKIRSFVEQLVELGDTVKADDVSSQLKTINEESKRQLKDRQELFTEGDNIISLGDHKFYTNKLVLDVSIVDRGEEPHFHITGTDFFEPIDHIGLNELKPWWEQSMASENRNVYRGEYLAFKLYEALSGRNDGETPDFLKGYNAESFNLEEEDKKLDIVRQFMAVRYQEGYVKGVHGNDALRILEKILELRQSIGLLKYTSEARALGLFYWKFFLSKEDRKHWQRQLKGAGLILSVFTNSKEFDKMKEDLKSGLEEMCTSLQTFDSVFTTEAAQYLFDEYNGDDKAILSSEAERLNFEFTDYIRKKQSDLKFKKSVDELIGKPVLAFELIKSWLLSFINQEERTEFLQVVDEVAVLLLANDMESREVVNIQLEYDIPDMQGSHEVIEEGTYKFHYNAFFKRLNAFENINVKSWNKLQSLKKELLEEKKEELKLKSFEPRVLSSFIRNQLIDEVYFPLIGANLAKQMGTAGEGKRTDLMGLLLLISPPGYGKTTLMEYLASRLGLIFMKINGPAIGHEVTSLDPSDAPNAASAEELRKLNLSFEMGNNVMIYLDDIQHCSPEFLQKFISLCDAQRKIEGVYKGKTKTYDFRGKKVCVVMAGNPYTESGDKFQIPDMLSNRADIYNLGDIIGDTAEAFEMSYIENSLTSNSVLRKLAARSIGDVKSVVQIAKKGSVEGIDFEGNHTEVEIDEYVATMKNLLMIQEVILKVNLLYIKSAAISDEYRVEPPFKLQGSYRDMNKMSEKVLPLMNKKEIGTLINSHYQNEAQTLTSNAEANLLRFKKLTNTINKEEDARWGLIIEEFQKRQKQLGYGQNGQLVEAMNAIAESIKGLTSEKKK